MPWVNACRSGRIFGNEHVANKVGFFLTAYDFPHILVKPIDNLEGVCCGRATLLNGQPIHSTEHFLDVVIPEKLLPEFLCSPLSLPSTALSEGWTHSAVPA